MGFNGLHAIANIINFLIFVFIIVKFAGPPIKATLEDRKRAALAAINEATQANARAAQALEETRTRLAGIDAELAGVVEQARKIALSQAAAVDEHAKTEAERIRVNAKAEIERERQAAVNDVRKLLLQQAFERAALELQAGMTPERQRELVASVTQKVGDGSLALK